MWINFDPHLNKKGKIRVHYFLVGFYQFECVHQKILGPPAGHFLVTHIKKLY